MLLWLALACRNHPADTAGPTDADADGFEATDDCDDLDPRRYPGAEEVCGDGVVNGCGMSEEEAYDLCDWPSPFSLDEADALLWGDQAADRAGAGVGLIADQSGDGLADLAIAAPHDRTFATRGGVLHVVNTPLAGEQVLRGAGAQLYHGDAYTFPLAFLGPGDLTGDGFGDLVVATEEEGDDRVVRLLAGPLEGNVEVGGAAVALIAAEVKPSQIGWSMDAAGDLDGDGAVDLVLGDPAQGFAGADTGGAFVVFGHLDGEVWAEDHTVLRGVSPGARTGEAVAVVGDADGDGLDDLMVGAPYEDRAGEDAGAAMFVFGPILPHFHHTLDGDAVRGAQPGARLGRALDGAGDLDGDGRAEALVSAAAAGSGPVGAGVLYALRGDAVGDPSDAAAVITGEEGQDIARFICGVGDLDGDGQDDLALSGAPGRVHLFYGPVTGAHAASEADVTFAGADGDESGPLGCGPDASGDGHPDLLIGRPGADNRGEDAGGAALLLAPGY